MTKRLTYKQSGVDITKANLFVGAIQKYIASTENAGVIKRKGSFGGLFALDTKRYREPVLVSSTDGVGTKLLIAKAVGRHDTVGMDLVAMNVNDILCVGAKPLFFLDYIACGKLHVKILKSVVKGITDGCRLAGCALVGGETAEMPGMYKEDEYDLAGFTVGVVEKRRIIDGSAIRAGDILIGLPSSGLHSNGFSLVRKVFSLKEQKQLADELLKPTRIYVQDVLPLCEKFSIKGIAHITGGAYYEKLTKILPLGKCFVIHRGSWPIPLIFQKIQKKGKIGEHEMFRTYNMGIGMVLVLSPQDRNKVGDHLRQKGITYYEIGYVMNDSKRRIVL